MKKINWPIWPKYNLSDQKSVQKVVSSNRLFAGKKEVLNFENKFRILLSLNMLLLLEMPRKFCILALAALNIGKGDEIITTPFSFISSASCILMQNAVPIFVDCAATTH